MQRSGKIWALKSQYVPGIPGPKGPGHTNDWYINMGEYNIKFVLGAGLSISRKDGNYLTHKAPSVIWSRRQFKIFCFFNNNKYIMRIVCWKTTFMKYHTLSLSKTRKHVTKFVKIGALRVNILITIMNTKLYTKASLLNISICDQGLVILYSYLMPVCSIVKTIIPRCRGRPDSLAYPGVIVRLYYKQA